MMMPAVRIPMFRILTLVALAFALLLPAKEVTAQVTAFRQAVAESAASDAALAEFYRARAFEGIWTGSSGRDLARRTALLAAFSEAGSHGLPAGLYDPEAVMVQLRGTTTPAAQGRIEVELSRLFLQYARDIQTGVLVPGQVIAQIKREVPYRSRLETLTAFEQSSPAAFLRALAPSAPEYTRLMREKLRLERLLAQGGYGPTISADSLAPGATGQPVVNLRNRLILMGFMERSATQSYDASIQLAVQRFQQAHGLEADGVAERWLNRPRGSRHIWVNLTDFTARIVDNDRVTFETRSVVGATSRDRQTPEFSDVMEFMVINPSWYVPRSIAVNEYLPMLQRNPGAVSHIEITDSNGRVVNRSAANFAQYTASTFPFSMREPPSAGNALGQVKFMFPNPYNIYLHDTPAQSLFARQVRAFSHGCVRLNDPFDFAYTLLARQTADPEAFFQARLRTGVETRVDLDDPVPVHIVYRTAFTTVTGELNFRPDIYDRDARIWDALAAQGVAVRAIGG